jgi:hypothetical protein
MVTSAVPSTTIQCSDRCMWDWSDRTPPGFTMIRFTWKRPPRHSVSYQPQGRWKRG